MSGFAVPPDLHMLGPIHSFETESFLRIAALSVGLYECVYSLIVLRVNLTTDCADPPVRSYLLTLPAEWRFYRAQRTLLRPRSVLSLIVTWLLRLILSTCSVACILFVFIRYISITVLIVSAYSCHMKSSICMSDSTVHDYRQLWILHAQFLPRTMSAVLHDCPSFQRWV